MTKTIIAQYLNADPADILTTAEAAAILGNTARAVTAAWKRGALVGVKMGESKGAPLYFKRQDVAAYAAGKQTWKAALAAYDAAEDGKHYCCGECAGIDD